VLLGLEVIECMKNGNRNNRKTVQALVISNAAIDETYTVAKLPRNGESLIGQQSARDVGGKGANVATVIARCGMRVGLLSVIGKGLRGDFVNSELAQETIELNLVRSAHCDTDISMITVDANGENTVVTTVEAAHSLKHSYACDALKGLETNCSLILQGNLTQELTQLLVNNAKQAGVKIVFNPSPWCPWMKSIIPVVDTVFMNAGEAFAITEQYGESAVTSVLKTGPTQTVLTRGDKSALLGTRDDAAELSNQFHIDTVPSMPTAVVDTTGAGDVFLAVALASAARRSGKLDVTALRHAAHAAAHVVSARGTRSAFPSIAELCEILAR